MLWEDALRALPLVARFEGPIVDVGSGGGSPGIPLAVSAYLPQMARRHLAEYRMLQLIILTQIYDARVQLGLQSVQGNHEPRVSNTIQ